MKNMFQIFEIRGKRFEYSNIIRSPKFSNPNIRDSRKKIRIRIESEYIRSSLPHCDFNVYLFKVHKKLTLVTCISKHFYLDKITVIKLFYALITAAGCN